MQKKGNKKMPTPSHTLIHNHNPIPTSYLFVVNALGKEKTSNYYLHCSLERNKDVGMLPLVPLIFILQARHDAISSAYPLTVAISKISL